MIPRKIHYAWFSGDAKPQKIQRCLDSWKAAAPDAEIIEWNATSFPAQEFLFSRQALERRKYAFATDLFRLWVLFGHGGLYLDSDVELFSDPFPLLGHAATLGLESHNRAGPHFMASPKGSFVIGELFKLYKDRAFIREDGTVDDTEMPIIITPKIVDFVSNTSGKSSNEVIRLLPPNICTVNAKDGRCVAEHHMAGSWKGEGAPIPFTGMFLRDYIETEFILNQVSFSEAPACSLGEQLKNKLRHYLKLITPFGLVMGTKLEQKRPLLLQIAKK